MVKPASATAIKQLIEKGEIDPEKIGLDVLQSAISNKIGMYIANLPGDKKALLDEANEKLREFTGGLISKEIEAGISVGEEITK